MDADATAVLTRADDTGMVIEIAPYGKRPAADATRDEHGVQRADPSVRSGEPTEHVRVGRSTESVGSASGDLDHVTVGDDERVSRELDDTVVAGVHRRQHLDTAVDVGEMAGGSVDEGLVERVHRLEDYGRSMRVDGLRGSRPVARRVGAVATVVAVAAVTVGAAGCRSTTPTTPTAAFDNDTIASATVRVRSQGCGPRTGLGTGTSIDDGLVITAAHVVAGSDHVDIVTQDDSKIASDVVLFDPDLDLAVLRPHSNVGSSVTLDDGSPTSGAKAILGLLDADGATELVDVTIVRPVTIRTTDIYRTDPVQRPGFAITATVEPGDSGAMVQLPDGGVGIVWARSNIDVDQAWAIAIPALLQQPAERRALVDPVDTGPCPLGSD